MKPIDVSVEISAPAQRAFEVFADIEGSPKRIPGIVAVEMKAGPRPAGVGTRWLETRRAGGRTMALELEISGFDAGRGYTVECQTMGVRYSTRVEISPLGEGRCRASMRTTATPKGWLAGFMAGLMRGAMAKGLGEDLRALKAACETAG